MAWIPIVASVAGSLISSMGQEDTNDTNLQIQQQNSAFNAEQGILNRAFNADQAAQNRAFQSDQAARQMDFQQRNSDSIWQRGVKDIQAAGLNPMLAYSQGGNPAASGAAATGSAAAGSAASAGAPGNMQNVFANAGQSATQWAQIENIQADTEKKRAEEEFTKAQTKKVPVDEEVSRQHAEQIKALTVKAMYDTDLSAAQKKKVEAEVDEVLARTKNLDADTRLKKVNEVLQLYDVPRMQAEADYFKTPVGKSSPHNKYGPQSPFRLIEGLGERIINKWSATPSPADHSKPGNYVPFR